MEPPITTPIKPIAIWSEVWKFAPVSPIVSSAPMTTWTMITATAAIVAYNGDRRGR
jgi:hypothetical protein